jgi:hypothetical protein
VATNSTRNKSLRLFSVVVYQGYSGSEKPAGNSGTGNCITSGTEVIPTESIIKLLCSFVLRLHKPGDFANITWNIF